MLTRAISLIYTVLFRSDVTGCLQSLSKKVTQNRSILMIDLHQFSFHVGEHLAITASQRGKTRIDYSLGKIQRQQNRKNYIRKNEIGYG